MAYVLRFVGSLTYLLFPLTTLKRENTAVVKI